ncbi:hypothetical protein UB44_08220 [Burkholderiaceae bacterium 26]|nr:hypothetical protein UB44_08220 [Burkholderiaceae bacterium 26]
MEGKIVFSVLPPHTNGVSLIKKEGIWHGEHQVVARVCALFSALEFQLDGQPFADPPTDLFPSGMIQSAVRLGLSHTEMHR